MSIKLNTENRIRIRKALIGERFAKQLAELDVEFEQLALRIYDQKFSPALQKKMEDLPRGWLPVVVKIMVRINGSDVQLLLPKGKIFFVPFDQKHHGECSTFLFNLTSASDQAVKYSVIQAKRARVVSEKEKLEAEINAILNSVTTGAKLMKIWPEAANVISQVLGEPQVLLPAPRVEYVNNALGLPPAAKPGA